MERRKSWMKWLALAAILTLGSQGTLSAQHNMSLKECIQYGLQHHASMIIADNDIAMATQRQREGLSAYLPQVNGSVTFDDNIKRPTTVIPAGTFSPTEIRVQFGNQYNTNAVVQLDQVIFDRGLLVGIKALDPLGEVAELNKEKTRQNLMYGVAMSYYQVQIYREQAKLLDENLQKFSQMEEVLALQLNQGVIKKVDYDRVAVTLANLRSQKSVLDNEIEMAQNRLKNYIGMPMNEELVLKEAPVKKEEAVAAELPKTSTSKVLDLKIIDRNLLMQELDLKRKQSMYLPTLSAYARYGGQSFGNEFGQSFNNWFGYSAIGLKLNVPIWNSLRTPAAIKQSELTLSSARENLKLVEANYQVQQENALSQWQNAMTGLESNETNLVLARQVLEVTLLQYEQGVATLSDYLTADYGFKEAQANYIQSLLRALTARLEFEKAQGTLDSFLLN